MIETDISTHKDVHLSATGDRRVRMSINRKVFYLTPEDSIALGDRLASLAIETRWDYHNQGETTHDLIR